MRLVVGLNDIFKAVAMFLLLHFKPGTSRYIYNDSDEFSASEPSNSRQKDRFLTI